jgi:transposase
MNTILDNMNKQNIDRLENKVDLIKIAIDMHLKSFRVVRQMDHGPVQPAQRFEPARFYQWLEKEQQRAKRVAVCYEAGCFGYEPARRMQRIGTEVYVIAPQSWDEQGKGQVNDKLDAAVMCRRLSDYLDGHHKALSVVHIPSRQEAFSRATVQRNAPDRSNGAQSLIAEGNGGARPLVGRDHLAADYSSNARLGGPSTGNLERVTRGAGKTHRPGRKTTAKQCRD